MSETPGAFMPDGDHGVVVFSRPDCMACKAVKRSLVKNEIPFAEVDVSLPQNEGAINFLKELGFQGLPVTMEDASRTETAFQGFVPARLKEMAAKADLQRHDLNEDEAPTQTMTR